MEFLKKKVLKCLMVSKIVNIGLLRPATFTQVIVEVVDIGIFRPSAIPQVIVEYMLVQ